MFMLMFMLSYVPLRLVLQVNPDHDQGKHSLFTIRFCLFVFLPSSFFLLLPSSFSFDPFWMPLPAFLPPLPLAMPEKEEQEERGGRGGAMG